MNSTQELYKKSRKKNKRSVSDEDNFYKKLFFESLSVIHHQERSFKIELMKKEKLFTNVEEEMQLLICDVEELNKKKEIIIKNLKSDLDRLECACQHLSEHI